MPRGGRVQLKDFVSPVLATLMYVERGNTARLQGLDLHTMLSLVSPARSS